MSTIKKENFFGLGVSVFEIEELEKDIVYTIKNNNKKVLYGHALWTIPMMYKYPEIYIYGEKADVLVTDGHLFYLSCKIFKKSIKAELSIPQLVYLTLKIANKNNFRIFLLGAKEDINRAAINNVKYKYKNISYCQGYHGYFTKENHSHVINLINISKADILLIGISSPMKEIISQEWKNSINTKIIIPCGGMIDVLANKTKLTPKLIKKMGLASLYRVLQEPRRLFKRYWFIYSFFFFRFLPVFIWKVIVKGEKTFSIPEYLKNKI